MATNGDKDADMSEYDGEKYVTMMDVLKDQQDFEADANAVLGASDDKNCTYSKGYVKRQAIYACLTCCPDAKTARDKRAGVCLACSLHCHENHELVELYTKRNFRCDCGNPKFGSQTCTFTPNKTDLNYDNRYNQNYSGLYCICHRPYPDPEATEEEEMIQCVICEDWLHENHLEATVPDNDQYAEMVCKDCMEDNDFLHDYSDLCVNVVDKEVIVTDPDLDVTIDDIKPKEAIKNKDTDDTIVEKESVTNGIDESDKNETKDTDEKAEKIEEVGTEEKNNVNGDAETVESGTKEKNDVNGDAETVEAGTEEKNNVNGDAETVKPNESEKMDTEEKPEKMDTEEKPENSDELTEENPQRSEEAIVETSNEGENVEISDKCDIVENPEEKSEKSDEQSIKNIEKSELQADQKSEDEAVKGDNEQTGNTESENKVETTDNAAGDATTENVVADSEKEEATNPKEETPAQDAEMTIAPELDKDIVENHAGETSNSNTNENKRKLSTEEAEDEHTMKKQKVEEKNQCKRPRGVKRVYKGATFWPNFRHKLCTCGECIEMYKDLGVLFLIDVDDTVSAYEALGQEIAEGPSSQYEKGLQALSSLDRVHQINALTEYNKMKDKLLDYLKSFKDKREIVKEEDIKAFFAGMKPKREPDGVYFCR